MITYLYGLSEEDYYLMLDDQDNKCAICKTDRWAGKFDVPNVDHNHDTGKVRGLLCADCNFGLGNFKDSIERLQSAIEYLHANPE
jgi:hypothetical protein